MKPEPQLSVFVPTYNYARFLGEALESILAQSFGDYELIVVDNASTDNTAEVMRKYKDPRIEYIVNPRNLGPYASFDVFLSKARGRFARGLCADDVLVPGVLEEQIRALNRFKNLGLVTCDAILTDERLGNARLMKFYPGFENGQVVTAHALRILENAIGGPSSNMYLTSLARQIKIDQTYQFVGDLKFSIQLLEGRDYLNVGGPGHYYRRHGTTWTDVETNDSLRSEEWLRLVKEYGQLCHLNCLRLLRRRLTTKRKFELLKWLATHLFERQSIANSFRSRKKSWVHANQ